MPRPLPYMKFHTAEFSSDGAVMMMTDAELGFYTRCLAYAWDNEGLPGSLELIARAFKKSTKQVAAYWEVIGPKFVMRDGKFINPRQEQERVEAYDKSEKARESRATREWYRTHSKSDPTSVVTNVTTDEQPTSNGSSEDVAIRAYSSSSSCSELKETPPEAEDFDVWAERQVDRHPNKRNKFLNLQALAKRFASGKPDEIKRDLFEHNHQLWCATPKWREKQGAFCPKLWEHIEDDEWKNPPINAEIATRQDPKTANIAKLQARLREADANATKQQQPTT